MQMPNITPAEWKVTVGVVATLLTVLFKLHISDMAQVEWTGIIVSVWATATLIGNAIIRHGRAKVAAALVTQPQLDGTPGHPVELPAVTIPANGATFESV